MTMTKTWTITAMFKRMMMTTDCVTSRIDVRSRERTMVHLPGSILNLVVTEPMKETMAESHDQKISMATIRGEIDLRTRETLVTGVSHRTTEEIVDVEADHRIEEKEGEVGHLTVIEEEIREVDLQTDEEVLHLTVVGMIEIVTDRLLMKITPKVCSICFAVSAFRKQMVLLCLSLILSSVYCHFSRLRFYRYNMLYFVIEMVCQTVTIIIIVIFISSFFS